jgi:hypothetical protein
MAASGFTPIQLFRTTTASATPTAMTLADGELAINLTDEKLYFKNAAGVVKLLAANLNVVANGGTGATTLSANGVLVGNGTSAVTAVVGTTGRVLTGNTGGAPTFEPITNVAVSSLSFGTTGLTPATATTGAITVGGTLAVANGGTGVTTSTGTGSTVRSNSPTLVTPTLGAASATSIANALGAVATPSYTFTGDLNTGMWSPAADTLAFSTNGAERARITSAGNVRIGGTSTDNVRLTVNRLTGSTSTIGLPGETALIVSSGGGASGSGADLTFLGGNTSPASINFGDTDSATAGRITYNHSIDSMQFNTNGSERMRITSAGLVGIGTTAPATPLDVFAIPGNSRVQIGDSGIANVPMLRVRNDTNTGFRAMAYDAFRHQFFKEGTELLRVDTDTLFQNGGTERMRITSGGNVLVGKTANDDTTVGTRISNFGLLSVVRDGDIAGVFDRLNSDGNLILFRRSNTTVATISVTTTATSYNTSGSSGLTGVDANTVALRTNSAERMRIDSSGNVGIGTTSPAGTLHLSKDSALGVRIQRTGAAPSIADLNNETNNFVIRYTGAALRFDTGASPTESMRITSAGNVGIGTGSPSAAARLDVASTTSGFLPPRMTTAQRDAISSPPNGLMLYNTTTDKLQVRAAGSWVDLH